MKIIDKLQDGKVHVSIEVFPPKTDAKYQEVIEAVDQIAAMRPFYISVTYGAGGGTSRNTVKIASHIKKDLGVESLAHLSCVSSTRETVRQVISELQQEGIENILALRGDIPTDPEIPVAKDYQYASQLIEEIRKQGDFCIGAACYPEGHVDSRDRKEDICYLKEKVDRGVDFLTTQMFFDNMVHYSFLYRIREKGITVPVIPGIMPVTNAKQMRRILSMSGTALPARFQAVLDRFGTNPQAMKQAGIAYATEQIIDLIANGINHIHIYSMNKPEVAGAILHQLSEIIEND
ncbi:MAG TPA: methylenetetrahydrofolate reductase [NAD(P)H] [Lachnospiraceae bacterium]|nr:methylenetetrahydrofolate reductase [NAD(P)H] [Lachnospiraceae bacterium]